MTSLTHPFHHTVKLRASYDPAFKAELIAEAARLTGLGEPDVAKAVLQDTAEPETATELVVYQNRHDDGRGEWLSYAFNTRLVLNYTVQALVQIALPTIASSDWWWISLPDGLTKICFRRQADAQRAVDFYKPIYLSRNEPPYELGGW